MADASHEERKLAQLIEEAVDLGATTVAGDVKRIQEESLGAIYDRIRDINHKVGRLAADLLESRKSA
jgi:hypothetical protein